MAQTGVEIDECHGFVDAPVHPVAFPSEHARTVAMFSAIVRWGKSPTCWITYPMPRRYSGAGTDVTSRPAMWITSPVGSTSRLIIFRVVVLPQPDGPTRTTISPSAISEAERTDGRCCGTRIRLAHIEQFDHDRHGASSARPFARSQAPTAAPTAAARSGARSTLSHVKNPAGWSAMRPKWP